jgi:predicted AAA+ superfamily ATPase
VGILELRGLTYFERNGQKDTHWLKGYLESPEDFIHHLHTTPERIYDHIWTGQLPALSQIDSEFIPDYLGSYIRTYLERDIRFFEGIKDMERFDRFLGLCAGLTGQEINDMEFGRELGVSSPTIKRWRARLVAGYQWQEISPYYGNTLKRLTKKSKGYLSDTGLACYLQRISSPLALASHPNLGHLYENFCVNLIDALCGTLSPTPKVYHWRTGGGAEVDLILDYNGRLYPIEMKCKTAVSKKDLSGLIAFKETYPQREMAPGLVLYTGDEALQVTTGYYAVPWNDYTV